MLPTQPKKRSMVGHLPPLHKTYHHLTSDQRLNLLILRELLPVRQDLIALSPSPPLPHNLLEPCDINASLHNRLGEPVLHLGCANQWLEDNIQIGGHEKHSTEPSHAWRSSDTVSHGAQLSPQTGYTHTTHLK